MVLITLEVSLLWTACDNVFRHKHSSLPEVPAGEGLRADEPILRHGIVLKNGVPDLGVTVGALPADHDKRVADLNGGCSNIHAREGTTHSETRQGYILF